MNEAPIDSRVYARNADGEEAWTWHDGDEWTRECWRENEDRNEYMSEEWWAPVEYVLTPNAALSRGPGFSGPSA